MKNTSSKSLKKKGGHKMEDNMLLFQAIDQHPDGPALVEEVSEFLKNGVPIDIQDTDEKQTILIRAFLKNKPHIVGYMLGILNEYPEYMYILDIRDKYKNSYDDYERGTANVHRQLEQEFEHVQGGAYKIYNNRKYKIYTGKRGGKYICVGVEKKKIYI